MYLLRGICSAFGSSFLTTPRPASAGFFIASLFLSKNSSRSFFHFLFSWRNSSLIAALLFFLVNLSNWVDFFFILESWLTGSYGPFRQIYFMAEVLLRLKIRPPQHWFHCFSTLACPSIHFFQFNRK